MANEYRKIMLMQIKNGVCLLCIFALMLLLAACFSLHTTQAEVRSFSVILLLVIGLLLMSVLALIAFLRYKMLRNKQQHQEEMNLMMALKMENVRNRFPPHFVFNVLNIFVSNLPKEVDVKPLHLLIQILRSYLLTCDKMAVSLEEELQMVMGYSSLRHETNPPETSVPYSQGCRYEADAAVYDYPDSCRECPEACVCGHGRNW